MALPMFSEDENSTLNPTYLRPDRPAPHPTPLSSCSLLPPFCSFPVVISRNSQPSAFSRVTDRARTSFYGEHIMWSITNKVLYRTNSVTGCGQLNRSPRKIEKKGFPSNITLLDKSDRKISGIGHGCRMEATSKINPAILTKITLSKQLGIKSLLNTNLVSVEDRVRSKHCEIENSTAIAAHFGRLAQPDHRSSLLSRWDLPINGNLQRPRIDSGATIFPLGAKISGQPTSNDSHKTLVSSHPSVPPIDFPTSSDRSSQPDIDKSIAQDDCLGCKLIGSGASTLAGTYILWEEIKARNKQIARHKPMMPSRTMGARMMQLIGWSFIGLGIARLSS